MTAYRALTTVGRVDLKLTQALGAVGRLIQDPFDYEAAIRFADATGRWRVTRWLYRHMLDGLSPEALEHLRRLTLEPIDLDALLRLPEKTFGHQFAAFMRNNQLRMDAQAAAFPPIDEVFAADWIMRRFARAHDMHHVLLDWPVDIPSEIGLQVFNLRNFREPYGLLALLSVPRVIAKHGEAGRTLREAWRGWRVGSRAANLLQAPLEEMFTLELDEVRRRLGLRPAAP